MIAGVDKDTVDVFVEHEEGGVQRRRRLLSGAVVKYVIKTDDVSAGNAISGHIKETSPATVAEDLRQAGLSKVTQDSMQVVTPVVMSMPPAPGQPSPPSAPPQEAFVKTLSFENRYTSDVINQYTIYTKSRFFDGLELEKKNDDVMVNVSVPEVGRRAIYNRTRRKQKGAIIFLYFFSISPSSRVYILLTLVVESVMSQNRVKRIISFSWLVHLGAGIIPTQRVARVTSSTQFTTNRGSS